MDPQMLWIAAAVVAGILVGAIIASFFSRKRLRAQLVSEYDQSVRETGSKTLAEPTS